MNEQQQSETSPSSASTKIKSPAGIKRSRLEKPVWAAVGLLALGIALLALWTALQGYFLLDFAKIGQPVVVDETVNPLVDFARFTCPLRYQYLDYYFNLMESSNNNTDTAEESTEPPVADYSDVENSTMPDSEDSGREEKQEKLPKQNVELSLTDLRANPSAMVAELKTLAGKDINKQQFGMVGAGQQNIPDKRTGNSKFDIDTLLTANGPSSKLLKGMNGVTSEGVGGEASVAASSAATTENRTRMEAFAGDFLWLCKQQRENPLKASTTNMLPEEVNLLFPLFDEWFSRVGGFRLYNSTEAIRAANVSDEDIWWTMGALQRLSHYFPGPFYTYVGSNELKPGEHVASIMQIPQTVPKQFAKDLAGYAKSLFKYYYLKLFYFVPILNLYDPNLNEELYQLATMDAGVLDAQLARLTEPKKTERRKFSEVQATAIEDRRNRTFTVAQLAKRFPHIGWHAYFQGMQIDAKDQQVLVEHPTYLARLDADFANKANQPMRRLLHSIVAGVAEQLSSLKYIDCATFFEARFEHANGYMYVKKFPQEEREVKVYEVGRIVKPIVLEYAAAIADSDWMTPGSKAKGVEKLKAMEVTLGWPEWYGMDEPLAYSPEDGLATNASIDRFYANYLDVFYEYAANFSFSNSSSDNSSAQLAMAAKQYGHNEALYMLMMIGFKRVFGEEFYGKLQQKPNRREGSKPHEENAFYNPLANSLIVTYAWIQKTYDAERLVENYGKIGMTIAHEIGHGFDPNGMLYGKFGTLERWTDTETAKRFDQVQQCVVEKFGGCCPAEASHYKVPCVDGWLTQGENFADISGLTITYRAFIKRQSLLHGGQIQLAKRKFWVAYGDLWCQVYVPSDAYLEIVMADPHSPKECRVKLAPQCVPQFFRDFGTEPPAGPRCYLWEAKPKWK